MTKTTDDIIYNTTATAAIKQYDPYKSSGIDGIYPVLSQKGINTLNKSI